MMETDVGPKLAAKTWAPQGETDARNNHRTVLHRKSAEHAVFRLRKAGLSLPGKSGSEIVHGVEHLQDWEPPPCVASYVDVETGHLFMFVERINHGFKVAGAENAAVVDSRAAVQMH
jgi:hypothetical protein